MPFEAFPDTQNLNPSELSREEYLQPYTIEPVDYYYQQVARMKRSIETGRSEGLQNLQPVLGQTYLHNPEADKIYLPVMYGSFMLVSKEEYLDVTRERIIESFLQQKDSISPPVVGYFMSQPDFVKSIEAVEPHEQRTHMGEFLVAHNKYAMEKAERLRPVVEATRLQCIERVHQLVADGVLPGNALNKLHLLKDIQIQFSDEFVNDNPDILLGGYFDPQNYTAYVSIFSPESDIEQIVTHELVHALSGAHVTKNLFGEHIIYRTGLRHNELIDEEDSKTTRYDYDDNEAVTQTITNLIRYPGLSIRQAILKGTVYKDERINLYGAYGVHIGAIKTLFRAYFHDDTVGEHESFEDHIQAAQKQALQNGRLIRASMASAVIIGAGVQKNRKRN